MTLLSPQAAPRIALRCTGVDAGPVDVRIIVGSGIGIGCHAHTTILEPKVNGFWALLNNKVRLFLFSLSFAMDTPPSF